MRGIFCNSYKFRSFSASTELKAIRSQAELVHNLVKNGSLKSEAVITSMRKVDRRSFLQRSTLQPYSNRSIKLFTTGGTVSSPTHHSVIFEAIWSNLKISRDGKNKFSLLDLGCASGYTSAFLGQLFLDHFDAKHITLYATEASTDLANLAIDRLTDHFKASAASVTVFVTNTTEPLSAERNKTTQFDLINIGYSCEESYIKPLLDRLKENGILLAPILVPNSSFQKLRVYKKTAEFVDIGEVSCQKMINKIVQDKPATSAVIQQLTSAKNAAFGIESVFVVILLGVAGYRFIVLGDNGIWSGSI